MFNVGVDGEAWHGGGIGQCTIPGSRPCVSFVLVPAMTRGQTPHLSRPGATVIDLHLPTDRPGIAMRCRIDTSSQDFSSLRRDIHRVANHRSSAWAIAGMVLPERLAADWGIATMAYAVMQALTAAGFSNLFHATGSFLLLFAIGAFSMVICGGLVLVAVRKVG